MGKRRPKNGFFGLKRIAGPSHMVERPFYLFQAEKAINECVSFFIFDDGPVLSDSSIFDGL